MLDNLQLPDSSALKVETQNWLLHSLLRGDIHRLLDPILMILLDPATARVSVLHVRIQQHDEARKDEASDDKTPRIYAISSVDGNVIYHVSEKCQRGEVKPGKAKRVFVQTTLAGQDSSKLNSKYITEKKTTSSSDDVGDPYQAHSKNLNLLQNISVFVNPLSREGVHKTEDINTDFDDYYEDHREYKENGDLIGKATRFNGTDLDKSKSKSTEGSSRLDLSNEIHKSKNTKVQRNNSFSSLEHDFCRTDSNQTTKSSIDILQLTSDTIFTKVSDGESLEKSRNGRGSISSEGLSNTINNESGELVRSWSFPGKDTTDSCEESTCAEDYFKSPNVSDTWNSLKSSEGWSVVEDVMSDLLDRVAILSGEVDVSIFFVHELQNYSNIIKRFYFMKFQSTTLNAK